MIHVRTFSIRSMLKPLVVEFQKRVEVQIPLPGSGTISSTREYAESTVLSPGRTRCQNVRCFPANALFFNFFMWTEVMLLKSPAEETKMKPRCRSQTWPCQWPLPARLQGAEGVTFGHQHSCSRTTKSSSTVHAVAAHEHALQNSHHDCSLFAGNRRRQ